MLNYNIGFYIKFLYIISTETLRPTTSTIWRDKNKSLACPVREKNNPYPKENHSSCAMVKKITCDFPDICEAA